MSKNAKLNSQYSALQGAYWMSFGLIISFAAVFLHDRGYSNSELGIILALGNIAVFILQPIVADFADRSKKWSLPAIIAAITLVMALAQLANFILPVRSAVVGLCYAIYICCTFLIQPLISSVAAYLESGSVRINFGIARGIGSLCYALIVAAMGVAVERASSDLVPAAGFIVSLLLLGILLWLARRKSSAPAASAQKDKSISAIEFLRRDPMFALLLLGLSLRYFSHAVINNFMINIVENLGGVMFDRLGVSTTLLVSAVITAVGVAMALPAIRKTR